MPFQIEKLSSIKDSRLHLPNSVALLGNGDVVIADGGRDGVFIFSAEGRLLNYFAKTGHSKYAFRQPVSIAVSSSQHIFVADWHNHRVVVFDSDLKYCCEFGRFGEQHPDKNNLRSSVREWGRRIRICLSNPSYISKHFSQEIERFSKIDTITCKMKRLAYLLSRKTTYKGINFNKPNGFAFGRDKLYITQKNSKCITMVKVSNNLQFDIVKTGFEADKKNSFGRLGNLCLHPPEKIYVCDEPKSTIWILNLNLEPIDKITGSDICFGDNFYPFACSIINGKYLAICGGFGLCIITLENNKIIHRDNELGELHGIVFDENLSILYLCNRSNAEINRFSISVN